MECKLPDGFSNDFGGLKKMPGGEAADYFVMTDCGKSHGCYAATLRAVGLAAELAWSDDGFEIGGDGVGGAGKDTVRGGLGWMKELL